MLSTLDLWLPIVVSAVVVFVVSSIVHMCLPVHRTDYRKLPGEDAVLECMRAEGLPPGSYMFPHADSLKESGSPEMVAKFKRGPVGIVIVMPTGMPAMGKLLGLWFLYCLVVGVFQAYVGGLILVSGATFGEVFRLTGTVGILGYAMTHVTDSIWKGVGWGITVKFIIDGIIYGLASAAMFAWLWPAA